ncbi:NYN domain-containing protein [Nicoliella spurrieriana]|uniref:NYN domain-containing protein n=1 Tax=Nicoliella spurrieriana TaxID=2925830 RepID=A0A976RSH6_9LACO|nr:NYN domain-containing protein [Nicoliella spurrieriana]UQS87019.1 NYN domain-containing protein [Nicoliella spurrieriana]
MKEQLLLVDAYNVIGSWPELNQLKLENRMSEARDELLRILSEYKKYRKINMVIIFDAMYVPGLAKKDKHYNLDVVWTGKDETADSYIESLARQKQSRFTQVIVVTSDQAEQWTVFSAGALRETSRDLLRDVKRAKREIHLHVHSYKNVGSGRNLPFSDQQLKKLAHFRDELSNRKR